jgi:uncharacterized protein
MKIGLLSDTHGNIDEKFLKHLKKCDEIWHAGDIGNIDLVDKLREIAPFEAVYGNIDNHEIRSEFPEFNILKRQGLKILMTHIGGYPNRYEKKAKELILKEKPDIFIAGHSHILKVIFDKKLDLLHLNPGAAGKYGFHKVRTMLMFDINEKIENLEIIELDRW